MVQAIVFGYFRFRSSRNIARFHMKMFIKVYQNNFCVQTIQCKYIKSQIF